MDNGLRNQSITGELGAWGQVMKLLPVEQLIPGDILGITCSPTAWLTSAGSRCFLCSVDTLWMLFEFVQSISRCELKLWNITCWFGTLGNGIGHWNLTLSPRSVVPPGFTQAPHSIRFLGEVKVNSCSETSLSTIWACPGSELLLSPPVTDVTWSCSELLGTEAASVERVGTRPWVRISNCK